MVKYVEICQRTKQYRLPSRLLFLDYDGKNLDELKSYIIDEHNKSNKEIIKKHSNFRCEDVIFVEIEGYNSGLII